MKVTFHTSMYPVLLYILSIFCRVSGLVLPFPSQNQTALSAAQSLSLDVLGQNVEAELRFLARQGDPRLSQAQILVVYVTPLGRISSRNIRDFQRIILGLRTGGGSSVAAPKYFWIANKPPQQWNMWLRPVFTDHAPFVDDKQAMMWSQVQRSMSIVRADALLKGAGYNGAFRGVRIAEPQGEPLTFCFAMMDHDAGVIVEVLTGVVRDLDPFPCP